MGCAGSVVQGDEDIDQCTLYEFYIQGDDDSPEAIDRAQRCDATFHRWTHGQNGTPAHACAFWCKPRMLERVLHHGGAVDLVDRYGYTPIMLASQQGHLECVRILQERGASLETKSCSGHRALSLAQGHLDVCSFLLEHGANPDGANRAPDREESEDEGGDETHSDGPENT